MTGPVSNRRFAGRNRPRRERNPPATGEEFGSRSRRRGQQMVRKLMLCVVLVVALPLAFGSAAAAKCKKWNAASADQHHKVGQNIDIVGGHGYGSGRHQAQYRSPPQPMGAYG